MRKTNKKASAITGDKIKFQGELTLPVTLNGTTKKVKVFVRKKSENLFGTDWMEQFKLWDQPINHFCHKIENSTEQLFRYLTFFGTSVCVCVCVCVCVYVCTHICMYSPTRSMQQHSILCIYILKNTPPMLLWVGRPIFFLLIYLFTLHIYKIKVKLSLPASNRLSSKAIG